MEFEIKIRKTIFRQRSYKSASGRRHNQSLTYLEGFLKRRS